MRVSEFTIYTGSQSTHMLRQHVSGKNGQAVYLVQVGGTVCKIPGYRKHRTRGNMCMVHTARKTLPFDLQLHYYMHHQMGAQMHTDTAEKADPGRRHLV